MGYHPQLQADRLGAVLQNRLARFNVYSKPPGDGAIEVPAIGIRPQPGEFIEYQRTMSARGLTRTHWFIEVILANSETEDRFAEAYDLLSEDGEESLWAGIGAALEDLGDEGITGAVLTATAPAVERDELGDESVRFRIPITLNQQRTGT